MLFSVAPGVAAARAARTARGPHPQLARLNVALTPENSYLQDFGGAVLRLPRSLVPGLKIKDPKKPIKGGSISMTFWYPDLLLTSWVSPMSLFLDQAGHKKYIPQRNRFRVHVFTLFYSKGSYQPNPTPHQIEKNRALGGLYAVRRIPTPYPGLMAEISTKWLKTHPEAAKFNPNEEGRFAEKPHSTYDLYMECGPPNIIIPGDNCRAYVYEKKHGFEYLMEFPSEAVAHTDGVIRTLDKLIDRWWVKPPKRRLPDYLKYW